MPLVQPMTHLRSVPDDGAKNIRLPWSENVHAARPTAPFIPLCDSRPDPTFTRTHTEVSCGRCLRILGRVPVATTAVSEDQGLLL